MEQVKNFFRGLFSTADWPPRWHCGRWSSFHGWLYIISDLAIWSAYFTMPVIIVIYISRQKNVRFHPIYFLFAAFILACGITHLLDAITFWYPVYRLNALSRFVAGAISWVTVFYLIKILPQAFSLKSATELEVEVARNREMKKQLELANVSLYRKVRELENANKELEQFAYISSHDLQEPIRKIQTFMGLLEESKGNDEEFTKYFNKISNSSARMKKLITEVLSYSKLSQPNLNFEWVELNEVVEEVKQDFEVLISEKNVTINNAGLPRIMGVKGQMTQLFSNLLSNAIKFSAEAPVITIHSYLLSNKEVSATYPSLQSPPYVKIIFQDNGIGFDDVFSGHIFKMFQRLNNRSDYEGTGIGLAICKKIVDNHHGLIAAKGATGKGATFEIILPVNQDKSAIVQ